MANLADVQYAQTGEPLKQSALRNGKDISGLVTYKQGKDGKPVYPQGKEWYIFKLVDNSKKGGIYIPNIDDVVNPATITAENPRGVVERYRLLSGVNSIWIKDQKDITEKYVGQNMRSIEFPRGVKIRRVAAHDIQLLEAMRVSNSNIGNPLKVKASRFEYFEYDAAMAEKEAFDREELELEAALDAKKAPLEEMKKHASFLGIRMVNDMGDPKGEDGIRREYVIYAKRNPEYFQKTKGTTQVEISWLVKKAIAESLIEIGREPGKAYWSNGGGMIGVYPQGVNPQDYLTELAMTNNTDGISFKEQLKKIVT